MKFTAEEEAFIKQSKIQRKNHLRNTLEMIRQRNENGQIFANVERNISHYEWSIQALKNRLERNPLHYEALKADIAQYETKLRRMKINRWMAQAKVELSQYAMQLDGPTRVCEVTKDDRFGLGNGERITRLPDLVKPELLDDESRAMAREMLGEFCRERPSIKLDVVDGGDIIEAYREQYFGSCMHSNTYAGSRFLSVYANSPHVRMITLRNKQNELVARALVWQVIDNATGNSELMLDRVYPPNDSSPTRMLINKAKSLGINLKSPRITNGSPQYFTLAHIGEGAPYLDTMCIAYDRNPKTGETILGTPSTTQMTGLELQGRQGIQSTNGYAGSQRLFNVNNIKSVKAKLASAPSFDIIKKLWDEQEHGDERYYAMVAAEIRLIQKMAQARSAPKVNLRALRPKASQRVSV